MTHSPGCKLAAGRKFIYAQFILTQFLLRGTVIGARSRSRRAVFVPHQHWRAGWPIPNIEVPGAAPFSFMTVRDLGPSHTRALGLT